MLAELADIEARLGRTLSPDEANAVTNLIEDVSALVTAYIRRDFTAHANDVVTLEGWAARELVLPGAPVTQVYRVEMDGREVTEWKLVGSSLWRRYGWQKCLGDPIPSEIKVTYTHGSAVVPGDVKAVVCNEVMRVLGKEVGATSETVGDHAIVYESGSGSIGLSRSAKASLNRFRQRTGTAPLRRS
ncbi:hypothetical protein GCM10010149_47490 [Nonomuraea roseoviolacea subsp. roseoviolacea]|uniref:hypothetical protein n=1 Tax=Nonomuraea roseoviolacea TaxID=103837 RepID=UPI0031D98654